MNYKYDKEDHVFYKGKEKIVIYRERRFDKNYYQVVTLNGQSPLFLSEDQLTPSLIVNNKNWKPDLYELYWFISDDMIYNKICKNDCKDKLNLSYGNYFKNEEIAKRARNGIRDYLINLHI